MPRSSTAEAKQSWSLSPYPANDGRSKQLQIRCAFPVSVRLSCAYMTTGRAECEIKKVVVAAFLIMQRRGCRRRDRHLIEIFRHQLVKRIGKPATL
jgi:hypothetical protein